MSPLDGLLLALLGVGINLCPSLDSAEQGLLWGLYPVPGGMPEG